MPVKPPTSLSIPRKVIPSGRGPSSIGSTKGQEAFGERVYLLFGKKSTDEVRRKCALAIVKQIMQPLLVDREVIEAVSAAASFVRNPDDLKRTTAARKALSTLRRRIAKDGGNYSIVRSQLLHVAFSLTGQHFPFSTLSSLAEMIANTLVWARHEANPKKDWWDWYDKIFDRSYQEMADIVWKFLPKRTQKTLGELDSTPKERFSDRRFKHPWHKFEEMRRDFQLRDLDDAVKNKVFAALDAFKMCQSKKTVAAGVLGPITQAIELKNSSIRAIFLDMLFLLSSAFESARQELRQLAHHPNSEVRLWVIIGTRTCPRDRLQPEFLGELLAAGLKDQTAKVRVMAAEQSYSHDRKDLQPLLEEMIEKETDAKTRKSLKFSLVMLRDGYELDMSNPKIPLLCINTYGGLSSSPIAVEDAVPERLASVAEQKRAGTYVNKDELLWLKEYAKKEAASANDES